MKTSIKPRRISRLVGLLLIVGLFQGCVSLSAGDEMRSDIEALQAEQQATRESLEAEKTRLTEMIASARQEVSELQDVLKEARALLQRNNADLGVELQKNREELSALNGRLEELDFKVKRMDQDLQIFKEDVDLQFSGRGMGVELPEEAGPLFEQGKKDYDGGNFRAARKAFEKFAKKFGRDQNAAEAQFLLGMTYFRQSQWATAVFEFRKVLKGHERSSQVDDATYHIALALMKMGRCEQASAWFDLLIDEHANSQWVGNARQHLKDVKAGRCR